jgi:hypothetical protein
MKKETLIAVIFGIALGGVVALFILIKGKDFEMTKNKVISPKNANQETTDQPVQVAFQTLEITSPLDGAITDQNTITIAGKAQKGSLIVIQSPVSEEVFAADKNDFQLDIPVALGENVIKIVAYPKDKTVRSQEKNLKIYYLDSEL